jgi:hypothetical protein
MDLAIVAILAASPLLGFAAAPIVMRLDAAHRIATVFAAGVLLGLLVTHLVPEVLHTAPSWSPALLLVGFASMMFVQQQVLRTDPCCSHEHVHHADVPAIGALGLCATNDGVLLATGTEGPGFASPLVWGLALHKIVAAFAFWTLLQSLQPAPGTARRLLYAAIFVAISPLAYAAAASLVDWSGAIAAAASLATGALLYVLVAGLLPQVEHHARHAFGSTFATFVLALALAGGVELLLPHEHGGHAHEGEHPHAHQEVHAGH